MMIWRKKIERVKLCRIQQAQKYSYVKLLEENLRRSNSSVSKHVYVIVTDLKLWFIPSKQKQNKNWLFECLKMIESRQKLFLYKSLYRKWLLGKLNHVRTVVLEDRRTVNANWYMTFYLSKIMTNLENRIHNFIRFFTIIISSHTLFHTTNYLKKISIL